MAIFASGCRIEALVSFDRNKTNTTRQKHHDRNRTTLLAAMSTEENSKPWRFVTNHTQVLLCISRDPDARLRDIAEMVGITERAVQRIVADLIEAGFVSRERVGRRSSYRLNREARMRHPAQYEHEIGEMLDLLELDEPGNA
jgi:DNA-binding MarR family transcriptional regulator